MKSTGRSDAVGTVPVTSVVVGAIVDPVTEKTVGKLNTADKPARDPSQLAAEVQQKSDSDKIDDDVNKTEFPKVIPERCQPATTSNETETTTILGKHRGENQATEEIVVKAKKPRKDEKAKVDSYDELLDKEDDGEGGCDGTCDEEMADVLLGFEKTSISDDDDAVPASSESGGKPSSEGAVGKDGKDVGKVDEIQNKIGIAKKDNDSKPPTKPKDGESTAKSDGKVVEKEAEVVKEQIMKPEVLKLRKYQEELVREAHKGRNCLIVAPTGTGKTIVAISIVKEHFDSAADPGDRRRVVFLVPTKILVEQQLRQFDSYLRPTRRCKGLAGSDGSQQQLAISQLIEHYDLLVMTPQILLNSLESGDVSSLSVFSLLVFDECHRVMGGGYEYNKVMSLYYVDQLLNGEGSSDSKPRLPQVVGLTASPGTGQAKSTDSAVDHILQLCANMASTLVCTVQDEQNKKELEFHARKATEIVLELCGRETDPFKAKLSVVMKEIEGRMKEHRGDLELDKLLPVADCGTDRYAQSVTKLKTEIKKKDQTEHRLLYACVCHLEIYNHALMINNDCRTKDALNYIKTELEKYLEDSHVINGDVLDETDRWLDRQFVAIKTDLEAISEDSRYENPKLQQLQRSILQFNADKTASRGIIFCKTRELTSALVDWMKDSEQLATLEPQNLIGTGRNLGDDGVMTQRRQEAVLKSFKAGDCRLIVATSIAEEGLDVAECNYVICYDHLTNEIARVQGRGRARASNAQYLILAERGSKTIENDEKNRELEKVANKAILEIQKLERDDIEQKIRELQRRWKTDRELEARSKASDAAKKEQNTDVVYVLKCVKCKEVCTTSADIRTFSNMHHVTIDKSFDDRITVKPCKHVAIQNWEKRAVVLCKKCNTEWGIKALYRGVVLPVLQVKTLLVQDPGKPGFMTAKHWKDVPFDVRLKEISDEELESISGRMVANNTTSGESSSMQ